MDNQPLLSEMMKRAATENSAMVEPVGRTETPNAPKSGPSKMSQLSFLAGLGLDVGTTAYGNSKGLTHEVNPLVKWAGNKGAAPAVAGMGIGTLLLSRLLGKSHSKIAEALLYGTGGAHGAAGIHNLGQIHKAPTPTNSAPFPGAVQFPDGSWGNPDFFTGR